jgi:hypothetical protein
MGWKTVYDAIFQREIDRLERIIERDSLFSGGSKERVLGKIKARQLLETCRYVLDFWLEDLFAEEEKIPAIQNLQYMVEAIKRNAGKGVLKKYLPKKLDDIINTAINELYPNVQLFCQYTKEFSRYINGWYRIRLNEPIQKEVEKQKPECYALLFGFHGSVADISDEELERYKERIKTGNYSLPGLVDVIQKFTFSPQISLLLLDMNSLKVLLENYLAEDEFDWYNRIYPLMKDGLISLDRFIKRKGEKLAKYEIETKAHLEETINQWKNELKEFHLEAINNYAYDSRKREELAKEYEYEILVR